MEDLLHLDEFVSDSGGLSFPSHPELALKAGLTAWGMAKETYWKDTAPRRFKQKLRWALAAALRPGTALSWFGTMHSPLMEPFFRARPLLGFKPLRAYMSIKWNCNRSAKVILDTYRFAGARGGAVEQALLAPGGISLATVALKGLGALEVHLGTDDKFRKEGELVLSLHCQALGGPIAALSFSLERAASGAWSLYVGCVQGGESGQAEAVRSLTKAMHGLRPKAMMVFLAQETARALGASQLLGAGSEIQAHLRKHAIHLPKVHALTFNYDSLWTESGGEPGAQGWFQLPMRAQKRAPEAIKPGKRSMYTRRYALLDDLSGQLQSVLGLRPSAPARSPKVA